VSPLAPPSNATHRNPVTRNHVLDEHTTLKHILMDIDKVQIRHYHDGGMVALLCC
jgi:hypothetical protein